MNHLKQNLSYFLNKIHGFLFPIVEEELDDLTMKHKQLIKILELVQIEYAIAISSGAGRPAKHRKPLARSFIAKAVYNMTTTRELIERLKTDSNLRRICG